MGQQSISVVPGLSRRCRPALDPDDHHLFVSLGCATENLVQSALANGWVGEATFKTVPADVIQVDLHPTRAIASPLHEAMIRRQYTRAKSDRRAVSSEELGLLQRAGSGQGITLVLMTEKPSMERVLQCVVQGNTIQMNDPAFVAELKAWIRFSKAEAVSTGDGLFSRSSRNPSVPRWLGGPLFPLFFRTGNENNKYARHISSSAGVAVFVSTANDKAHWIEAGRCYERFALQATALGIRNAFLNQPVEVSAVRSQFASWLGIGHLRPDLVVRFGQGLAMQPSLRRPIQSVLV